MGQKPGFWGSRDQKPGVLGPKTGSEIGSQFWGLQPRILPPFRGWFWVQKWGANLGSYGHEFYPRILVQKRGYLAQITRVRHYMRAQVPS